MLPDSELEAHKHRIDQLIKDGIDKLLGSGDILESDFVTNTFGDKMITILDEAGDEIVFNYTQVRVHSYAGRLNE
jgi:hypothetical protein